MLSTEKNRMAISEILEKHQPLMRLEEKHRPHIQLFDTEEKIRKDK
jgi:hypothetical protein